MAIRTIEGFVTSYELALINDKDKLSVLLRKTVKENGLSKTFDAKINSLQWFLKPEGAKSNPLFEMIDSKECNEKYNAEILFYGKKINIDKEITNEMLENFKKYQEHVRNYA